MQGKVSKIRENIKPPYDSKYGTLYVHGVNLENDPVDYEVHQQTQTLAKIELGKTYDFDVTEDKRGNKKLKIQQARSSDYKQQPAQPFAAGVSNSAYGVQQSGKSEAWALILGVVDNRFPQESIEQVIARTNTIYNS